MLYKIKLTAEQQGLLDGDKGEVMAKVMKTLVMYGEAFGATHMEPITSKNGHIVLSFGLSVIKPVFELFEQLIEAGVVSQQPFTADPRPIDKNVPMSFAQKLFFKLMYPKQDVYEKQLESLGILNDDAYTCTCYMDEVGNAPNKGEILSWAESSAVVYANSVLGARCNRNSGILELFGSIVGCVPYFGLLTDEGRKATWIIDVKTTSKPEAQVLGSAIGMKVMEDVPYIRGLDKYIDNELNDSTKAYFKDMGAATASNGAVGLYHVEGITPEAIEQKESLIAENPRTYVIDDAELESVKNSYPCIWKKLDATPKICFIGCPHLSIKQLKDWTELLEKALKSSGEKKVVIPTVFTAAPAVIKEVEKTTYIKRLKEIGVVVSYICPLMYMNNPLCAKMPVITNSNKLRTYSTARYHTDSEIVELIVKGVK